MIYLKLKMGEIPFLHEQNIISKFYIRWAIA